MQDDNTSNYNNNSSHYDDDDNDTFGEVELETFIGGASPSSLKTQQRSTNETSYERRQRIYYDTVQNELHSYQQHKKNHIKKKSSFLKSSVTKMGNVLQKINIGKWIDELEKDQVIADQLEKYNKDIIDEQKRKQLVRDVHEKCLGAVREHLNSFLLEEHNDINTSYYEDWISELHPDNVIIRNDNNKNSAASTTASVVMPASSPSTIEIDARYYLVNSDHRMLWNEAITKIEQQQQENNKVNNNENHVGTDEIMSTSVVSSSRIVEPRRILF